MANCELGLVPLNCDRTGVGFTARPLDIESNKLHLIKGHAKHFPTITDGQYFYIRIKGCDSCCEVAKVVAIEEDTLTLDRTTGNKCTCIMSNAQVSYEWDNLRVIQDVAYSIGINAESPLKYDPCTRTLSVDCKELFSKDCGGCGCGETKDNSSQDNCTPGLRGEQGERGEPGVGIATLTITNSGQLSYTLTDGSTRIAGTLPTAKGVRGLPGERGERGEQGPKGEDGTKITAARAVDGKFQLVMSDNTVIETDASSMKGDKGETGAKGEKGEKGDAGYSFQYIELDKEAVIFGFPKTQVTLQSPSMPGVTLGPYTTGEDGLVTIPKPPTQGKAVILIKADGATVGIGRTG